MIRNLMNRHEIESDERFSNLLTWIDHEIGTELDRETINDKDVRKIDTYLNNIVGD
jgi:hypothetical protein